MQHVVDVVPDLGRGVVAHLGGGSTSPRSARAAHCAPRCRLSDRRPALKQPGRRPRPGDRAVPARQGHSIGDVRNLLQRRSRIVGIAGAEPNVEATAQAANRGDRAAHLALAVSTADVAITIAGGTPRPQRARHPRLHRRIGEHAAVVRSAVTDRVAHLGVRIVPSAVTPGDISVAGAAVLTLVVAADEGMVMDRQARELFRGAAGSVRGSAHSLGTGSAGLEVDPPGWP